MTKKDDKFFVQSVNRTFEIIEKISENNGHGVSITEISKSLDLPVSTVYRLIQNLVTWNYVHENSDGLYTLGVKFIQLGAIVLKNLDLRKIAHKYMEELNEITKETIYLAILDEKENDLIYVEKLEGKRNVTLTAGVGTKNYLHSTANGKCILSGFGDEKIKKILSQKGLPALTEKTITQVDKLLAEVQKVRELGYAIDDLENEPNVRCVAAPIFDYRKTVVASVSISGVSVNITEELMHNQYKDLVIKAAAGISKELGYRP